MPSSDLETSTATLIAFTSTKGAVDVCIHQTATGEILMCVKFPDDVSSSRVSCTRKLDCDWRHALDIIYDGGVAQPRPLTATSHCRERRPQATLDVVRNGGNVVIAFEHPDGSLGLAWVDVGSGRIRCQTTQAQGVTLPTVGRLKAIAFMRDWGPLEGPKDPVIVVCGSDGTIATVPTRSVGTEISVQHVRRNVLKPSEGAVVGMCTDPVTGTVYVVLQKRAHLQVHPLHRMVDGTPVVGNLHSVIDANVLASPGDITSFQALSTKLMNTTTVTVFVIVDSRGTVAVSGIGSVDKEGVPRFSRVHLPPHLTQADMTGRIRAVLVSSRHRGDMTLCVGSIIDGIEDSLSGMRNATWTLQRNSDGTQMLMGGPTCLPDVLRDGAFHYLPNIADPDNFTVMCGNATWWDNYHRTF